MTQRNLEKGWWVFQKSTMYLGNILVSLYKIKNFRAKNYLKKKKNKVINIGYEVIIFSYYINLLPILPSIRL